MNIEVISEILRKPAKDRTKRDYDSVHTFMTENIMFFKSKAPDERNRGEPRLSLSDKMKMYKVMQYRVFNKGDNLCEFGEKGDSFHIILEGTVGIRVPMTIERGVNSTWDIYQFLVSANVTKWP